MNHFWLTQRRPALRCWYIHRRPPCSLEAVPLLRRNNPPHDRHLNLKISNARGASDLPSFSNLAASSNMNNDACKRGDDDSSYFSDSSTGSYARRKRAGAAAKTSREGDAKQSDREKENKPPRGAGKQKVKKSKPFSNVSPGGQFGHGHHRRRGRFFAPSPIGRPMILSRRLSYRINNSTPMKSPITATTLNFSPSMKRRPGRHFQSSLERIGHENKPAAKRSKASNKRNSV